MARSPDENSAWVERTAGRALAYAISLLRNRAEAEDVVHDCYCRLLARSREYDLPRDGEKLLFKAVTNACINKAQRRPPEVSLEEVGFSTDRRMTDNSEMNPELRAEADELREAIAGALAELPVNQRAAVELRSLGHSSLEVAGMLDVSQANARVLIHRARQSLAVKLQAYLNEDVS